MKILRTCAVLMLLCAGGLTEAQTTGAGADASAPATRQDRIRHLLEVTGGGELSVSTLDEMLG